MQEITYRADGGSEKPTVVGEQSRDYQQKDDFTTPRLEKQ